MRTRSHRPEQDPTTHDTTHLSTVSMQTGGQSLTKFLKNNLFAVEVVGKKKARHIAQEKHTVSVIAK